jgi:ACS family D-galactonate transporter-like MFS transporter
LSLLWAGATTLTGLSWSVASLVVCRVLVGIGDGGAFPTATRAFTWWQPVRERGFAQGITALGAASLVWTAIWLASFRDTPEEHPWMTGRMWLVTVVDFCYGWSLWGRHARRRDLGRDLPEHRQFASGTADAAGRRLGGSFAFIVPAIVTGSALGAVGLLAAAFFFLELTNAALWTLPLDIAGQFAGTAGGMMNTGFGVAGMISPVVFGVLIERTGRYELPLFISAALLLVGALCSLRIDPTLKVQTLPSDSKVPV